MTILEKLPLMIIQDAVVFPNTISSIAIIRNESENSVKIANYEYSSRIFVSLEKKESKKVTVGNVHETGVICTMVHIANKENGKIARVVLSGETRAKIISKELATDSQGGKFIIAHIKEIPNDEITEKEEIEIEYLRKTIVEHLNSIAIISEDKKTTYKHMLDLRHEMFADAISHALPMDIKKKQEILEKINIKEKIEQITNFVLMEKKKEELEAEIKEKVDERIQKNQKEYFLREKLGSVQDELGKINPKEKKGRSDYDKYKTKYDKIKKNLPAKAKEKALEELEKLEGMHSMSSDGSMVKTYLDTIFKLPWTKFTKKKINVAKASETLEQNHYGMDKVKERIVEYIAVQSRSDKPKGQVLCFCGPPGVGKTTIVKSIAQAMNREYGKFPLGGVNDEAAIRGHRRTYIGALPGKVIQIMKNTGTANPVILLDEIDKIGTSHRGDPASALLEVLDPSQNKEFEDHYLELGYDLSNVTFIATANSLNIPHALLDRLEVIQVSGYTEQEKKEIAIKHIISAVAKDNNLKDKELTIEGDVILDVIRYYTMESGVRDLERQFQKIARKAIRKILEDKEIKEITITKENLKDYLGVRRYKFGLPEEEPTVGATVGLAYTSAGGDILIIEARKSPKGKGEIKTTGNLKDVMKESIQTAFSYVHSRAEDFGIDPKDFRTHNVHIHVPEGATPKDGPSAGITIATTLVSLFANKAVRNDIAMTGEITLRGKVLPIGGLKEKTMSALRSGIKTVLIPQDNEKDLEDIPDEIKNNLEIIPVSKVSEVIKHALVQ